MNIRNRIEGVLLPHFHRIFPDADGKDLFFFGKKADIFSPIFFKKGIDIRPELVYNIFNETKIDYIKLFSLVETSNGYINFRISDEALSLFAKDFENISLEPADTINVGQTPECLTARLLDAANTADRELLLPIDSELVHKALWICMAADSPSSARMALRIAGDVLDENRRNRVLSKSAALTMAAALSQKNFKS